MHDDLVHARPGRCVAVTDKGDKAVPQIPGGGSVEIVVLEGLVARSPRQLEIEKQRGAEQRTATGDGGRDIAAGTDLAVGLARTVPVEYQ